MSPSVNWRLTVKAQIGSREFTPGVFERLYPGDGMGVVEGGSLNLDRQNAKNA